MTLVKELNPSITARLAVCPESAEINLTPDLLLSHLETAIDRAFDSKQSALIDYWIVRCASIASEVRS